MLIQSLLGTVGFEPTTPAFQTGILPTSILRPLKYLKKHIQTIAKIILYLYFILSNTTVRPVGIGPTASPM